MPTGATTEAGFNAILAAACTSRGSHLCVGLDPVPEDLPEGFTPDPEDVLRWVVAIVEATSEFAAVFKPNSAFFEALGPPGMEVLQAVIAGVPREIPVILDAKRGDIGHTGERYATAAFDVLGAAAVTVNPYLGGDSLLPFTARADRGAFVVCRTSNPGARDLQDLQTAGGPVYLEVARRCREWNGNGNVGLVTGATYPEEIGAVRAECPGQTLLIPGVGAQGADAATAARQAAGPDGDQPFVISASRSLARLRAGMDLQGSAAEAARELRDEINAALSRAPR